MVCNFDDFADLCDCLSRGAFATSSALEARFRLIGASGLAEFLNRHLFFSDVAMRVAPKPEEIAEIYIDESSQTNHRYLVLGGVGLKLTSAAHLSGLVMDARSPELPKGEAKWTRVSKRHSVWYICHTPYEEGEIACEDASGTAPWLFHRSTYARAFLLGPPGGGGDPNIGVAYGTCTKF